MAMFIIACVMGSMLGFLAGLGVGGGSLLLLWLTLVLGMDPEQARNINLLFFLPSAIITSIFRCRQGSLRLKPILPAIIAGCLFAVLGSLLGRIIPLDITKKLFGGLLLFAGIRELKWKPKED